MDTFTAIAMSDRAKALGKSQMIFDWHKAARLIKEHNPQHVSAGLNSDWEYTGGDIYTKKDGPLTREQSYTYLSSNWATPEIDLDGEVMDCFICAEQNTENWNANTFWPQSALDILNA